MNPLTRWTLFLVATSVAFCCSFAQSFEVLVDESFDRTSALPSGWALQGYGDARARVLGRPGGGRWLVLDDRVEDGVYSQAVVSASIQVKGYGAMRLSFDSYSFGSEYEWWFEAYDGVSIAVDGEVVVSERYITDQGFPYRQSIEFNLSDVGPNFDPTRFYQMDLLFLQYGKGPADSDGWAIDNVKLEGAAFGGFAVLQPIDFEIREDQGYADVEVAFATAPQEDVLIEVREHDIWTESEASVVFEKGEAKRSMRIPLPDDELFNMDRGVYVELKAPGFGGSGFHVWVVDDDDPEISLEIPDSIREDGWAGVESVIKLSRPVAPGFGFSLTIGSEPAGEIAATVVRFNGGQSESSFWLNAVDDLDIEEDETVTVVASGLDGRYRGEKRVTIVDDDAYSLSYDGITSVEEGEEDRFRVFAGANALEEMRILVTASPSGYFEFSDRLIVQAGQSYSDELVVRAAENGTKDGDVDVVFTFELEGRPEVELIDTTITHIDNEIDGFGIQFGPFLRKGTTKRVRFSALDTNGERISRYEGTGRITLILADGSERALFGGDVAFTYGGYIGEVLVDDSFHGARVRVDTADGVTSTTIRPLCVYELYPLGLKDIVYSYENGELYALAGEAADASVSNSLVRVDIESGTLEKLVAVDSKPRVMSLSPDGSQVLVGSESSGGVQVIDLASKRIDRSFILKGRHESDSGRSFVAEDILLLPGLEDTIVVSQNEQGSSSGYMALYKSGVLAKEVSLPNDRSNFVLGRSAGEFFSKGFWSSGAPLTQVTLDEGGTVLREADPYQFNYGSILGDGDYLYSSDGSIIDMDTFERVGFFQRPVVENPVIYSSTPRSSRSGFDIDPKSGWAVFSGEYESLHVFDIETRNLIETVLLERFGDVYSHNTWEKIEVCGGGVITILTRQGDLVIVDDPVLAPSGEATDLSLTFEGGDGPIVKGESVEFEFTVENRGQVAAEGVTVDIDADRWVAFAGAVLEGEVVEEYGKGVALLLGDLAPGESVAGKVSFSIEAVAPIPFSVRVRSDNRDDDRSNNNVDTIVQGTYDLAMNRMETVEGHFENIVWHPDKGLFFAYARWDDPVHADTIVSIDPRNGVRRTLFEVTTRRVDIALSVDGKKVYVTHGNVIEVYNIELDRLEAPLSLKLEGDHLVTQPDRVVSFWMEGEEALLVNGSLLYRSGEVTRLSGGLRWDADVLTQDRSGSLVSFSNSETSLRKVRVSNGALETSASMDHDEFVENGSDHRPGSLSFDGGMLLSNSGDLIDASDFSYLGSLDFIRDLEAREDYPIVGRPVLDAGIGRAFFSSNWHVYSYNLDTRSLVRRQSVRRFLKSRIRNMYRWGDNGVAFSQDWGGLVVGLLDIVPDTRGAIDLAISGGNGRYVDGGVARIEGFAFAPTGNLEVTVNGRDASWNRSTHAWSCEVDGLVEGMNRIAVKAESAGQSVETQVVVIRGGNWDLNRNGVSDDWEEQHSSQIEFSEGDLRLDHDSDGRSLWFEYLLGTNPLLKDSAQTARIERSDTGETFLVVSYRQRKGANVAFEYSAEFSFWNRVDSARKIVDSGDGFEKVEIWMELSSSEQFYRMSLEDDTTCQRE